MNKSPTVLDKVWTRIRNQGDARMFLVKDIEQNHNLALQNTQGFSAEQREQASWMKWMPARNAGIAIGVVTTFLKSKGFKKGDRAALCGWDSAAWEIFDLAILGLGGVSVPIFPTTKPEGLNYILKDSGAKFFFAADPKTLAKASTEGCQAFCFDEIPSLVTGVKPEKPMEFAQIFLTDKNLSHFVEARCAGMAEVNKIAPEPTNFIQGLPRDIRVGTMPPGKRFITPRLDVTREDLATIVYTSGSTGVPKGVMITHGNFAAACEGIINHGFQIFPETDVYLAYLPVSHVYERAAGMMLCLWTGVPQAFCRPDIKGELGSVLKLVRPNLLHGVPAVWRKIMEDIVAGLAKKKGIAAKIVAWAMKQKRGTVGGFFADLLVFSKIRGELGGAIRICTSGGGAISKELLQFFHLIGIEVLQGYGLTETTGAVTINRPMGCGRRWCNKFGAAGQVLSAPGLELRIAPIPGQEKSDQGEIQIRGPVVMVGYWMKPEETKKTFTEDGWFRTGDIGRVDEDGYLWITGRLKRMLKTDGGKYVPPEKIDKAFDQLPIVQAVVAAGDGMPFISGLIFLNHPLARELLTNAGVAFPMGPDVSAFITKHPLVVAEVEKAVATANTQLENWEQLKTFRIIEDEATTDNGLLTDLKKVRTEEALKRYAAIVEEIYRKKPK